MAAGQVDVQFLDMDVVTISGAVAAIRKSANDKWMATTTANGQQLCIIHVEEA